MKLKKSTYILLNHCANFWQGKLLESARQLWQKFLIFSFCNLFDESVPFPFILPSHSYGYQLGRTLRLSIKLQN